MVRCSHPAALFALAATAAVASSLVMVPPPPRRLHRFARSRSPVVTLAAAPAADEADVDLEEVMVFANEGTIECKTCRDKYYFPKTQEELEDEAAAAATVAAEDGPDLMDMLAPEPPPHAIDEERLPGVYHLGLHQTSTIGVSPYLIVRPEGNVMVDVPAWSRPLAERLDELGGADYLILTSGEMTEGHEAWKVRVRSGIRCHRNLTCPPALPCPLIHLTAASLAPCPTRRALRNGTPTWCACCTSSTCAPISNLRSSSRSSRARGRGRSAAAVVTGPFGCCTPLGEPLAAYARGTRRALRKAVPRPPYSRGGS